MKMFQKVLQCSQENPCVEVSILIKTYNLWKKLFGSYFGTAMLENTGERLYLESWTVF